MKKITNFSQLSSAEFDVLRKEIDLALQSVGVKYNITLKTGNCRYTNTNASIKIEACIISELGESLNREVQDFKDHCTLFGLKLSDLGRTFNQGRKTYKIVGIRMSAKRYPIVIEDINTGKKVACTESLIKQNLK